VITPVGISFADLSIYHHRRLVMSRKAHDAYCRGLPPFRNERERMGHPHLGDSRVTSPPHADLGT